MVHQEQLFTAALQLQDPFFVRSTDFSLETGELHLYIDFRIGARFSCPVCREAGKPVHDTEDKGWRHLNFFQYKAFIHCRTPRVSCTEHGVRLIEVPWAAPGSGFTLLFEALVLGLAKTVPVSKMVIILQENDTRIWRIIRRYVDKARKEADYSAIHAVGIDQTSSRKGQNFVTLFVDLDKNNWDGILNDFNGRLTSGIMESLNSVVQSARNRARGCRNVENFITMI